MAEQKTEKEQLIDKAVAYGLGKAEVLEKWTVDQLKPAIAVLESKDKALESKDKELSDKEEEIESLKSSPAEVPKKGNYTKVGDLVIKGKIGRVAAPVTEEG